MEDIILLKLGEIVLKGLNKRIFEDKLMANVRRRIRRYGKFRVYTIQSTVYVEPEEDGIDMDAVFESLKTIFGAVSLVRAAACAKNADAIFEKAREYLGPAISSAKSFKVESKRSDKSFPMTSTDLSRYVGGLLSEAFPDVPVDVHRPDFVVNLEVRDYSAYVHGAPVPGAGGLPVGCNGSAVALLSGGIDSPVSTYLIAKRGVHIIPVHFFSFPYTSELAKEKVLRLANIIAPYCGNMTVEIVPFTHIQEEIRDKCGEEFFTIIMRRFMTRISEKVALSNGCKALVTGESLGQVASQTMEAMSVTEECVSLPVLRPLIGFDKTEIIDLARRIGTYETSILPYEDCCTVFTPRHPKTKPNLEEVLAAESPLDIEALVDEAFKGIERVEVSV